MREEYDFSEAVKNPYVKPTKATVAAAKGKSLNSFIADAVKQAVRA